MSECEKFSYKEYSSLYPIRMLVADDRPDDLTTMSIFLESMGYSPDYSLNGVEVLEDLGAGMYDLIFMDVRMPQLGGVEATKLIREREQVGGLTRGAYVVGFSAFNEEGVRDECMEAGMNGYFNKPIELCNLARIIEACAEWMNIRVS